MSLPRWKKYLSAVLLLILVSGCGYHLTGTGPNRFGTARSVWVPFFSNESISPTAQTVLRRTLYDELHALRGLAPADSAGNADLVINAKLISYASRAVSYSAEDRAREYALTVTVELEISRKGEGAPLWKGQLSGVRQFPAGIDLALQRNAEEHALHAAAGDIARKFITAVEEAY